MAVSWSDRPGVGMWLAAIGISMGWLYVCTVFIYAETVAGLYVGSLRTALVFAAGVAVSFWGARRVLIRRPQLSPVAVNIGLASIVSTTALLSADLAYAIYANWQSETQLATMDPAKREYDRTIWHGELFPRRYYPTDQNFFLYKPNVRLAGQTYGEFYHPDMLGVRQLADSVLELRLLTYDIGPLGLRESGSLSGTRIFALGDSFAMGYGTREGATWTDVLGDALGEPVYNMGISSTGPRQQYLLLEHMLEVHQDSMRIDHLLWMLFEGNDLENSYAENRPGASGGSTRSDLLEGTVIDAVLTMPGRVKNTSVLRKALATLARGLGDGSPVPSGGYDIGGLRIPYPLYHSDRWGFRLFNSQDVDRATNPREYVLTHPNRPRLEETIRDMATLSRGHGFSVTVIIAPSAARMYGPAFDGFPPVSGEPHFISFLRELATENGFRTIDLLTEMRPFADEDLLYYRDDHHWNARGNMVAASVIQRELVR